MEIRRALSEVRGLVGEAFPLIAGQTGPRGSDWMRKKSVLSRGGTVSGEQSGLESSAKLHVSPTDSLGREMPAWGRNSSQVSPSPSSVSLPFPHP